jgi:hypothetical protein
MGAFQTGVSLSGHGCHALACAQRAPVGLRFCPSSEKCLLGGGGVLLSCRQRGVVGGAIGSHWAVFADDDASMVVFACAAAFSTARVQPGSCNEVPVCSGSCNHLCRSLASDTCEFVSFCLCYRAPVIMLCMTCQSMPSWIGRAPL